MSISTLKTVKFMLFDDDAQRFWLNNKSMLKMLPNKYTESKK